MDALGKLRQRNRRHVVLKSGLAVAYHLPDAKLCIVEAEELEGASQLRKTWTAGQLVIAKMLEAVDGEEITERDDRLAMVAAMDPEERAELDELASPPSEDERELEELAAAERLVRG